MGTSSCPSYLLAWRIFRYLLVRLIWGAIRLTWWMLTRSILFVFGLLRLLASPASSGRAQDEFKDLVQPGSPEGQVAPASGSDGFWRMYLQAYSPRLWRMRRLFPLSAGKDLTGADRQEDG